MPPQLSAAAQAELTRQYKICADDLRKLREAASANSDEDNPVLVLKVIERLAKLPVTAEVLRETGAGREVNDRFVRTHANTLVKVRSKELVHAWKRRVTSQIKPAPSSPPAVPIPAEAPSATPLAAAPTSEADATSEAGASKAGEASSPAEEDAASPAAGSADNQKKRKADGDAESRKEKKAKDEGGDDGPNADLVAIFKELSGFEFKKKERFKGVAYKNVAATLKDHPEKITSGKEAQKLPSIGPESAKKIDQFLNTGQVERLEKYRRGEME